MKTAKIKTLNIFNALIAFLLAVLGFGSCSKNQERFYGGPYAGFILNGKVVSSETSEPISNIRIILEYDTAFTDQEGNYMAHIGYSFGDSVYHVAAEDIDSALNGEFEKLDTLVEFKNPVFFNGDGDWNRGDTSVEFDLKLNPKK